jgi:hypothetical protein
MECGTKIPKTRKCSNPACSFEGLPPDAKFCPECGKELENAMPNPKANSDADKRQSLNPPNTVALHIEIEKFTNMYDFTYIKELYLDDKKIEKEDIFSKKPIFTTVGKHKLSISPMNIFPTRPFMNRDLYFDTNESGKYIVYVPIVGSYINIRKIQ